MKVLQNAGLLIGLCVVAASAQTNYTFQPTSGDWNIAGNWQPPGGPPEAGDTATIGDGKTCKIQNANQAIKSINFSGTGKLELIDKTLAIGSPSAATTITNALIWFKDGDNNANTVATLKVHNNTTFFNGVVRTDAGTPGKVTWATAPTNTLHLDAAATPFPGLRMTLIGSIEWVINLTTTSRVKFDVSPLQDVTDTMTFGGLPADPTVYTFFGAADVDANYATVIVRKMNINGADGKWETNYLIRINAEAVANATNIYFYMQKSGLIDVYSDLRGRKIYMDSFGIPGPTGDAYCRVKAAQGVVAIFEN